MTEQGLTAAILAALGSRPDCRVWRQNTGVAAYGHRAVRFGVPGQADISGILAGGRRLELEVKRPGERTTPEQDRWGAMIVKFGGVYAVVRSVEEAVVAVENAR